MGKKATFVIDESVLTAARSIVETSRAKSLNSFVESAIKDQIEKIRRQEIKDAIIEAGRDPLFLADIKEAEYDFEFADFEY